MNVNPFIKVHVSHLERGLHWLFATPNGTKRRDNLDADECFRQHSFPSEGAMKHGLRHEHLTQHWHGHIDTTNVKNIGHRHRKIYVNLFKDGLKWKLKYIYKHLTWAIYLIRKSSTRYHSIWPLFIHLISKKLKMI